MDGLIPYVKLKKLQKYLNSGLKYKGVITSLNYILPPSPNIGDFYKISGIEGTLTAIGKDVKSGDCVVWNGSSWDLIIGERSKNIEQEYDDWASGIYYNTNDKVIYNDIIYECIIPHTSTVFDNDKDKWIKIIKEYVILTKTQYELLEANNLLEDKIYITTDDSGSIIDDSGSSAIEIVNDYSKLPNDKTDYVIYYCLNSYTDNSILYSNGFYLYNAVTSKWELITNDKKYNKWKSNNNYNVNDIVEYDNKIYKCIMTHTSTNFNNDLLNWIELDSGFYKLLKSQYEYLSSNNLLEEKIYLVLDDN